MATTPKVKLCLPSLLVLSFLLSLASGVFLPTCPDTHPGCSEANVCKACHPACALCQRVASDGVLRTCAPHECVTCAPGLNLTGLTIPEAPLELGVCTPPVPAVAVTERGKMFVINLKRRP